MTFRQGRGRGCVWGRLSRHLGTFRVNKYGYIKVAMNGIKNSSSIDLGVILQVSQQI